MIHQEFVQEYPLQDMPEVDGEVKKLYLSLNVLVDRISKQNETAKSLLSRIEELEKKK